MFIDRNVDLLNKRINTHKVLRQLQLLIRQNELTKPLWETLLQVFLAIGDTVLSPPYSSRNKTEQKNVSLSSLI